MNKIRTSLYAASLLIACSLFVSCSESEHAELPTGVAAVFTTRMEPGIGTLPTSRAIDNTWTAGDAIGIAMLKTGVELTTTDVFNKYTAASSSSSSALQPAAADQMYYFPAAGDNMNFIAYYPYGTVSDGTVTYTMADQSTTAEMEAVDAMYAARTGDYNKSNPAVALSFKHLLSKLVINVSTSSDDKAVDLSTLSTVTIDALPASVTLDLSNGDITAATTKATTTAFIKSQTDATAEVHAVIVPHTGTDEFTDRKITFTAGDNSYSYWLPLDAEFKAGEEYAFTLKVTTDGVEAVK